MISVRTIKLLCGLLAAMAPCASAFAEQWLKLNEVNGNPLYVDSSRLSSQGDLAQAWIKVTAAAEGKELRWLFEFACSKGTYRTVESITTSRTGVERFKGNESDPFKAMGATSGYAPAFKLACKPVLEKAATPSETVKPQPESPSVTGANPVKEPVPTVPKKRPKAEVAAKPDAETNSKTKAAAWRRVAVDSGASRWYVDTRSVTVNGPFILGWLKIVDPSSEQPMLVLQEYDCDSYLQRAHAFGAVKFEQPGGWTQSSTEVRGAFTPYCKSSNQPATPAAAAKSRRDKATAPQ